MWLRPQDRIRAQRVVIGVMGLGPGEMLLSEFLLGRARDHRGQEFGVQQGTGQLESSAKT